MNQKIDEYLRWKSSYAKTAGYAYEYPLKKYFLKIQKSARDIKLEDIVSLQIEMNRKLAPATSAYYMSIFKDFLGYLYTKTETSINPRLLRIPRYVANEKYVATSGDLEQMLKVLDPYKFTELRNRVMLLMLYDTGIRISELVGMNISQLRNNSQAVIHTSKTTRSRLIMWSESTNSELLQYLGVRLTLDETGKSEHLFVSTRGTEMPRITTRQVQRIILGIRELAGLEGKLTAHSFRHHKAHDMIDRGANVKEIASVLGHSEENPVAAFQYLRQSQNELKKVLERFI